ncbi:MAG: hydrogenase maturation nickel metallochaperone HypA [Steroidobacteraceae bacterium]
MHELSICQALMEQVERVAAEQRARRVVSVTLKIGPLAGVEPALLESAFPLASAGTVAADSKLIIERAEVRVQCLECGAESQAQSTRLLCGACGNWRVRVLSGEELLLASVELERDDD